MRSSFSKSVVLLLGGMAGICVPAMPAEEVLFIGNSFTYGGSEAAVKNYGGVPKMVEAIAAAKGKTLGTLMVAASGKDWGYHLSRPATFKALAEKPWNWIVLQDFSTKPTHLGNLKDFLGNGETLYRKAREAAPQARILLYETWARQEGHKFYAETSSSTTFKDPAEMTAELVAGYAELQRLLEAIDPEDQVSVAPVGTAFALCLESHPEIPLFSKDKYHASPQGSYLAALVLYASLFSDSPLGATREFPGITFDAQQAEALQEIARQACERLAQREGEPPGEPLSGKS